MRKLLISVIAGLCLSACDMEMSHNGDLDGFWVMDAVDTVATGRHSDLQAYYLTWGFQGRLLELRSLSGAGADYICRFDHSGDSLRVFRPCIADREHGDSLLAEVDSCLRLMGVNHLSESYLVLKLNHKQMTLRSKEVTLHFSKY